MPTPVPVGGMKNVDTSMIWLEMKNNFWTVYLAANLHGACTYGDDNIFFRNAAVSIEDCRNASQKLAALEKPTKKADVNGNRFLDYAVTRFEDSALRLIVRPYQGPISHEILMP